MTKRNKYRSSVLVLRPEDDYVPDGLPPEKTVRPDTVRSFISQRTMRRATPCNPTDPVNVCLLVDMLLRLNPASRVTARELTPLLRTYYPQVLWDAYNVGKMLSNLHEVAQASGAPADEMPLKAYVSAGSKGYALSTSLKAWRWLITARVQLAAVAEQSVGAEIASGKPNPPRDFPYEAFQYPWGS